MVLEICASNYQSALNAQKAGAHRIELCQELAVGGVTPSYGLIKQVIAQLSIPVFVLIRPRSGNFTYTDQEFEIMLKDIQLCKKLNVAGIVSGVLLDDFTIDVTRTRELVALAAPLPFTFHRAFDWVKDPYTSLDQLITIGVKRVLTSGLEDSAQKGLPLLNKLKNHASNKITIIPGGGISYLNAGNFVTLGFDEIHASATKIVRKKTSSKVNMNSVKFLDDEVLYYSDKKLIQKLLKTIK